MITSESQYLHNITKKGRKSKIRCYRYIFKSGTDINYWECHKHDALEVTGSFSNAFL